MPRQSALVTYGGRVGPGRPPNRATSGAAAARGRPDGPRSGNRQARDLRRSAARGLPAPGVAHKLGRVGKYVRSPPAVNSALAERGTHEAKGTVNEREARTQSER